MTDLISTSPSFDYHSAWERLGLNPTATFSTKFLVQAGLVSESEESLVTCLDDLSALWNSTVQELRIDRVDSVLELIYRQRPETSTSKRTSPFGKKAKPMEPALSRITQETQILMAAIEASLKDLDRGGVEADNEHSKNHHTQDRDVPSINADTLVDPSPGGMSTDDDPELLLALQLSLMPQDSQRVFEEGTNGTITLIEDSCANFTHHTRSRCSKTKGFRGGRFSVHLRQSGSPDWRKRCPTITNHWEKNVPYQ